MLFYLVLCKEKSLSLTEMKWQRNTHATMERSSGPGWLHQRWPCASCQQNHRLSAGLNRHKTDESLPFGLRIGASAVDQPTSQRSECRHGIAKLGDRINVLLASVRRLGYRFLEQDRDILREVQMRQTCGVVSNINRGV